VNILLWLLLGLAACVLICDAAGWHMAIALTGRRPRGYPMLYWPFVALWRLWRK
jgi:hypothetical protein